ncbi:ATP-binding protein [Fictibacillus sp. B-59209]
MHERSYATAMLDRLLHHSRIFNLNGESYRLKEKRNKDKLEK